MKIRITSIAAEEVALLCRTVTVKLEDLLGLFFANRSYAGTIDEFILVVVAVDSDASENQKYCRGHEKVGVYKHPVSQQRIRFISLAMPFDPREIASLTHTQFFRKICEGMIQRLRSSALKIPRTFDYDGFSSDLREGLQILNCTTFDSD